MAEFSEVMKHKKRLCKSEIECSNCPLAMGNNGKRMPCDELEMQYPKEYEEILMKWAEEHPMITNRQKLLDVVAKAFGEKISKEFSRALVVSCSNLGGACDGECPNCEFQDFWDKEYQAPKEVENDKN